MGRRCRTFLQPSSYVNLTRCAIVLVCCVLASFFGGHASGAGERVDLQPVVRWHFDEPEVLRIQSAELIVTPVAGDRGLAARLSNTPGTKSEPFAADPARLRVSARDGGWGTDGLDTRAAALAVESGAAFVTPVYITPRGEWIVPSADLLVGLKEGLRNEEISELVGLADAGEVVEFEVGGMPSVVRVRTGARTGAQAFAAADRLVMLAEVRFAEPDSLRSARQRLLPTDPLFAQSWGLRNVGQSGGVPGIDVRATLAWDLTIGEPDVIVVVLDDGVELAHPDLVTMPGRDFTPGASAMADGNPVQICDAHGTAVAGVIAAALNNGLGSVGLAPGCVVTSARVFVNLGPPCMGLGMVLDGSVVNALSWAESIGARVTNTSLSLSSSSVVQSKYAQSRGVGLIHFASSGNNGATSVDFPGRYPSVHAVGAIDATGALAVTSNRGPDLECVAPGSGILTTDIAGSAGYVAGDSVFVSGTSFAAPFAAGAAALVISEGAYLQPDAVIGAMREGIRDLGDPGPDTQFGHGLIDAHGAILALAGPESARLTGLGDRSGGAFLSHAHAIAPDGAAVVGEVDRGVLAPFRRTPRGLIEPLSDSFAVVPAGAARGVSAGGGVIVGEMQTVSGLRAFRWSNDEGLVSLGTIFSAAGALSRAGGVSADGSVIVGSSTVNHGVVQAFRWTEASGMVSIGDLPGGGANSEANGVSADGVFIVGGGTTSIGREAFRWSEAGGFEALGDFAGGAFDSLAYACSSDGSVVVGSGSTELGIEAFRWTVEGGMERLGDLPGGEVAAAALAVSADGSVVVGLGSGKDGPSFSNFEAFIWTHEGGMRSLKRELIEVYGVSGASDWRLEMAWGISADGRTIVGMGVNPNGDREAWLVDLPRDEKKGGLPTAFELLHPGAGAELEQSVEVFEWTVADGALGYVIEIASGGDFDEPLLSMGVSAAGRGGVFSYEVDLSALEPGSYLWRVVASNDIGERVSMPDSSPMIVLPPLVCSGDADRSGSVTPQDVMYIIGRLGTASRSADVDGNGVVDLNDVTFTALRIGACR